MQARFYLPMYGRFASPDPARDQHFEETQSWNIYSYVRNNPVMMTDPTGEVAIIKINGNSVSITLPVKFGRNSDPAMKARFIQSVQKEWSGKFGGYNVTTKVVEGAVEGVVNRVFFYGAELERSCVTGGDTAYIATKTLVPPVNVPNPETTEAGHLDKTMAHEAGHLMNIGDGYKDVSKVDKNGNLTVSAEPLPKKDQPGASPKTSGLRSNSDIMVNTSNPSSRPTGADIKEAIINPKNKIEEQK